MNRSALKLFALSTLTILLATGCATTRARKADPAQDPQSQIAGLQSQLVAKDQEIADLKYQVESSRQALPSTNFSSGNADSKDLIRVSGVSASDVQRSLMRAGYDPGPIDGKLGKKTKSAIKAFQRKQGLTADGVIGEKTWAALKSS